MKKILLTLSTLSIAAMTVFGQTTATDFTANDCSGTSHHLFGELNAGKIIVVSFVMPCGPCIGPSLSAKSVVNSFATSHPGRVLFYIADDDALTDCTTLTSWASANGMSGVTTFSTTSFIQTQYGTPGMPKVVVLGGTNHHVYLNENNTLNTTNLQNAINSALSTTGIAQVNAISSEVDVFPNPTSGNISVRYSLATSSQVNIEILNIVGAKVKTINAGELRAGSYETSIHLAGELSKGIYLLKLNTGETSQVVKFIVSE